MRFKTATWYEIRISYDKMGEDGNQKKVNELYSLDALSFTEAENSIIEEMSSYISGEFIVKGITKASYKDVIFSDMNNDDRWFKCKVEYITIDEKTAKEKRTGMYYLVQAATLPQAVEYVDKEIGKGMADFVIASIAETKILDVFEHEGTKKQLTEKAVPEWETQPEQTEQPAE